MTGTRGAVSAEILAFPNSEDVLLSILENASIGMTLVDASGSVVYRAAKAFTPQGASWYNAKRPSSCSPREEGFFDDGENLSPISSP